ncbi:MAG: hypothetical protein OMM_03600 [Candidatus Magnetoglobus multicellularis str. Araruama]|uniref:Flagellar hook-length control protein-like C-terminal domain-containing protein n=1 Tax=Candidatus Magnetoglobus multicellularis str. Araruama TaxID=890399 RepID=A0A1V1P4Z9_9BACT|nr:MAG: hypothetical protein OMM_03600 [Candidatus Magnetoglobus multicellularis str. Araruama]
MQATNLEFLLADVRTRTFNPTQSLASIQQSDTNSLFSMLFDQTLQMNRDMNTTNLFSPTIQPTQADKQSDYIDSFGKDLMSTGVPMERFSLSSQAKSDLQEIMTGQGYSETEVNNFLNNVFQEGGSDTVKVSNFMKMYAENKPALEKNQPAPAAIEASDVPVIEKGLKEFGLTANQVKVAIENSRTESGDLDVKQLVQELASIHMPVSIDRPLSDSTQVAVNQILSKLGIKVSEKSGPMTFNQFVSVIRSVATTKDFGNLSEKRMSELVSSLMANIRQTTQRKDVLNIRQLYQSQLYQLPGSELDLKDRPALENALRNMGLSADDIQKIMAKVIGGSDKISLANLVETLKTIKPKLAKNVSVESLFNSVQLEKSIAKLMRSVDQSKILGQDISKDLQHVLKKLGLSDKDLEQLIAKSSLPSGKIDMDRLIANLKSLTAQSPVIPKEPLTKDDLQTIQRLMDHLKGADKINVSQLMAKLDTTELNQKIKAILTQLGVPKEKIPALMSKAQGVQDSLSIQQLMAQLSNMLEKAGVKTNDQNVKTSLQTIETLLSQIQLTNQTISKSDLADLKNMLKQFGASTDTLNKVFPPKSDQTLTLAQFAKNLKDVLPQLNQGKKVAIPENTTLKNVLANLSKTNNFQTTPKTMDAFVRQLETIPKRSQFFTALQGKPLTIPPRYINDLKSILKDLGFQSGKINDILPKNTQNIPVQPLLAKLRPDIAKTSIPPDQLKKGFARLDRLMALIQSKGKNDFAAQLSADKQKDVAATLSKLISGQTSLQEATITSKQIPILERALVSYGMSQKDAQKLIAQVKDDKGDILLSKLSDALKSFSSTRADNVQVRTFVDHMDAYLALLEKQSTNKDLGKRGKNIRQQVFQNLKDGKGADIKNPGTQNAGKLAEARQQAQVAKMVTQQVQGNSAETVSAATQGDDNNAFLSFLKQESASAQSAKMQNAPKLPERPVPYYLNQQVGRQLANAIRNNENQVTIQLRPPHLGTLQLDLEIQNNILRVGMATDNQVTRDILVSHINDLRESLGEQGIKIDEVDIQINYDLGQSLANDQQDVNERNRFFKANSGDEEPQDDSDELTQAETRRPIIYGDSSLSLIV